VKFDGWREKRKKRKMEVEGDLSESWIGEER